MQWCPRIRGSPSGPTSIPANARQGFDVAIIGSGIAGIAAAYYLSAERNRSSVLLIDYRQPMSYTSAQSGDNYRNWWPHPTMTAFTSDSIELMRNLAIETDNVFKMTDRGYLLATRRSSVEGLVDKLQAGDDVEIISDRKKIGSLYPALSPEVMNVIHVKRAGDLSGQQLGLYMLERFKGAGGKQLRGEVKRIRHAGTYTLDVQSGDNVQAIKADVIVNAAGPFVGHVARMLDIDLPVKNVYQQKIMFDDQRGAIPRDMPFTIDLDEKRLAWSDDERAMLMSDRDHAWLAGTLPSGTHCRPEGGERGSWVKLGWAYNNKASEPRRELANEAAIDPQFPEIVLRGAAALLPALTPYVQTLPRRFVHYGGYYTMTTENWPLIGPMGSNDRFVLGALSGFGTMAACAAGKLIASWVAGDSLPSYATHLCLDRYEDAALIDRLQSASNKGLL